MLYIISRWNIFSVFFSRMPHFRVQHIESTYQLNFCPISYTKISIVNNTLPGKIYNIFVIDLICSFLPGWKCNFNGFDTNRAEHIVGRTWLCSLGDYMRSPIAGSWDTNYENETHRIVNGSVKREKISIELVWHLGGHIKSHLRWIASIHRWKSSPTSTASFCYKFAQHAQHFRTASWVC